MTNVLITPPQRQQGRAATVARFLSGRPLDGQPRTNASWLRPGTRALTTVGYASRWHHYSHRRRAGIQVGGVATGVLLAAGLMFSPVATVVTLRVITWVVLLTVAWVVAAKCRRWAPYNAYVVPTARAVGDLVGVPRHVEPRTWVHVPSDHRTDPDRPVTIDLPEGFNAPQQQQRRLAAVAAKYLRMTKPDWGIDIRDNRLVLWLRACPTPPEQVVFGQVRELAEQSGPGVFVIGLGARRAPVTVSLNDDSPHILASIGSGGGKSNFGRWTALQAYSRGSRIMIIDIVKRGGSHKWAKGVDGIEVYRHPDTAHEALLSLYDLVEDRCESSWHHGQQENQPILLIIEESNRTLRKLQSYWANQLRGTKTSPAVLAIEGILCVGREANVNAVTVGQRMSAQASGGGDARENYGARLGNRYTIQTAKMLFGGCSPLPQSSQHPGRVQVVVGDQATEAQIPRLFDGDDEPLRWATERRRGWFAEHPDIRDSSPSELGRDGSQDIGQVVSLADRRRVATSVGDPADEPDDTTETTQDEGLVTLAEAAAALEVTRPALANARAKDPEFPPTRGQRGVAKLYDLTELQRWLDNRERRPVPAEKS